ncbi:UDP-N-acetylglucosamine 1-carboxyvinyltransferase [Candidatus Bipolaricaulota bacterium]|nr:UDP-N-acetylglucosamine 1-carboxyvinyltransferase [Candidatus Bipolaricaulota bacterium]
MTSLLIEGGEPLRGSVPISGAKNAALPACVATLLTEESVILHAVPQLRDVSTILYMLGALGKRVVRHEANVSVASGGSLIPEANAYSVGQMRASFLVLGPLVARLGRAVVPLPGGCAIGARPVDLHLDGLRALGAHVEERVGAVVVTADRLKGSDIHFPFPSVGATEQIIMASCLAAGGTSIHNASTEPEVMDLIDLLTKMGAVISVTDRTIHIEGQQSLGGAEHTLIPDRMEAGTLLLAGAITRGSVSVSPVRPEHLQAFLDSLRATGLEVEVDGSTITSRSLGPAKATEIVTSPYPGFPTDLHPPMAAYLSTATGRSLIVESVFERRFAYTRELSRMGARMVQDGSTLTIDGGANLTGQTVEAPDIRGGAALVLAGLAAKGRTIISGLGHIDRGHAELEKKLRVIGARIERREDAA